MTKFTAITTVLALLASTSTQAFVPTFGVGNAKSSMTSTAVASQSDGANDENVVDRRAFGKAMASVTAAVAASSLLPGQEASALPGQEASGVLPTGRPKKVLGDNRVYFKGKVTLRDDNIPPAVQNAAKKALILTAKPKNAENVPPEVIRAGRGSVPAVFTAIIPQPDTFPQKFTLTSNDITPEGDFGLDGDAYWWADEPEWEISARVDTDGSLRTASSNDLVGRTITSQIGEDKPEQEVCVAVQERGFLGSRFQTKQNV
mmetsp:Transcript_15588/g.29010  ORF Transcript_15588/g.29010 Transcript_15588/m.29010 type:complete len:260 (-) Transcript_15588:208-987(-)